MVVKSYSTSLTSLKQETSIEDGDDFYEAPLDFNTPSTSAKMAQPQPLLLTKTSTLWRLYLTETMVLLTQLKISIIGFEDKRRSNSHPEASLINIVTRRKLLNWSYSMVLKRVKGARKRYESVASPAKKRKIDSVLHSAHLWQTVYPWRSMEGQKTTPSTSSKNTESNEKQAIVCEMQ